MLLLKFERILHFRIHIKCDKMLVFQVAQNTIILRHVLYKNRFLWQRAIPQRQHDLLSAIPSVQMAYINQFICPVMELIHQSLSSMTLTRRKCLQNDWPMKRVFHKRASVSEVN